MASRRDLKKEINNISAELISECLTYKQFHPKIPDDRVDGIIREVIRHRNEYLARANKPDGKNNPSLVKKHYSAIVEEMRSKTIPLLDKLQEK
jgi:hypothetical protein